MVLADPSDDETDRTLRIHGNLEPATTKETAQAQGRARAASGGVLASLARHVP
jgi:hypothetical protein